MAIRLDKAFGDGADVCATSGLSSPAAVQATLSPEVVRNALLRAHVRFCERSPQRSALCDSDATVASGEETLLDDGGGAKLSSVRD